jgi:hypothetical protein
MIHIKFSRVCLIKREGANSFYLTRTWFLRIELQKKSKSNLYVLLFLFPFANKLNRRNERTESDKQYKVQVKL